MASEVLGVELVNKPVAELAVDLCEESGEAVGEQTKLLLPGPRTTFRLPPDRIELIQTMKSSLHQSQSEADQTILNDEQSNPELFRAVTQSRKCKSWGYKIVERREDA